MKIALGGPASPLSQGLFGCVALSPLMLVALLLIISVACESNSTPGQLSPDGRYSLGFTRHYCWPLDNRAGDGVWLLDRAARPSMLFVVGAGRSTFVHYIRGKMDGSREDVHWIDTEHLEIRSRNCGTLELPRRWHTVEITCRDPRLDGASP